MGILRIKGTIKLEQFWPKGDSDSNGSTVEIALEGATVEFDKTDTGKSYKATTYYQKKKLKVNNQVTSVVRRGGKGGKIIARLQGADAPELRYPAAPAKLSYRQRWAESAALALRDFLTDLDYDNNGNVACEFRSANLKDEADVIDVYGRFVGDVYVVNRMGNEKSLSQWVLENGWALPVLYESLDAKEVKLVLEAAGKGARKRNTLWDNITTDASNRSFDKTLSYRKKISGSPKLGADAGALVHPKVFRLQATLALNNQKNGTSTSLKGYLAKADEELVVPLAQLANYRKGSFKPQPLAAYVNLNNAFTGDFTQLVFIEHTLPTGRKKTKASAKAKKPAKKGPMTPAQKRAAVARAARMKKLK